MPVAAFRPVGTKFPATAPQSRICTARTLVPHSGANETFVVVLRPRVTGVMQSARATVDYKYKCVG